MEKSNFLYYYLAVCERVVDGDTFDFFWDLGKKTFVKERTRLFGANTPEIFGVKKESEEYALGCKSRDRVIELIEGKEVIIQTIKDTKGKYGRYLVNVFFELDGEEVNLADLLVKEGLAEYKTY